MRFLNHFVLVNSILFIACSYPLAAKKIFSHNYAHYIAHSADPASSYVWIEKKCPKFHEIILSWNAISPPHGSYSFYISCFIRNEWTGWKRYAVWGKHDRLTFSTSASPRLHTKHVRAVVPQPFVATGFRVRVKADNGANIKDLHALFCSVSHEGKFRPESAPIQLESIKVTGIEAQSQMELDHCRKYDLCSPTALSILINFLAKNHLPKQTKAVGMTTTFADKIHDQALDIYGSWPLNVAQAYEELGGKFYFHTARLNGFGDIHAMLKKNIPVVVSIRGPITGGARPYKDGHFIIVAGWNQKHQRVLCIDPAFKPTNRTKTSYAIDEFLIAWERSRRLSYIAEPRTG